MHQPFHATRLNRWLYRRQLHLGRGVRLSPRAVFSINRGSHIRLGERCEIGFGAILACYGGQIEIGDGVGVNPYSILYGHGGLRIGNNVRIAAHCTIVPANHVYANPMIPIHRQGISRQGIDIGDDVWIGANCVVLDGSSIGEGCVVAAGAVVRGHLPPFGVYAGVPAKRISQRQSTEAEDID